MKLTFSLLVFTGSQGSKNCRRARHHDATFMMKTKRYKKEDDNFFFFLAGLVAFQMEKATIDFSFWVSPGTWSETLAGQT